MSKSKKLTREESDLLAILLKKEGIARDKPIARDDSKEFTSLSPAEQRLWFLCQLFPEESQYNQTTMICLDGDLDHAAMETAFNAMIERHEALRTAYVQHEANPMRKILPAKSVLLPLTDLAALPVETRERTAQQQAACEAAQIFEVTEGFLFRIRLYRLAERRHVLFLCVHHIISDAWSMGILFRELSELYGYACKQISRHLPPLPVRYSDFAEWQLARLNSGKLNLQLDYWESKLQDLSMTEFPTNRPRMEKRTQRRGHRQRTLDRSLCDKVEALSVRENATSFMTMLSAFSVLVRRYCGADDFGIGSSISGRNQAETEGLIGFFINTLVFRIDLTGNPTFRDLLGRVQQTAHEAFEHQEYPFEKLVEHLAPKRDLDRTPLFQIFFNMLNFDEQPIEFQGLTSEPFGDLGFETKFDLTLYIHKVHTGLCLRLGYNRDLFDAVTIDNVLAQLECILRSIVTRPDLRLSQIPVLTTQQRNDLIVRRNATSTPYPESTIHQLFQQRAALHPDSLALEADGNQISFGTLNALSNRLARYLRKNGVATETPVGICVDRSINAAVGLLAILKAGGAFLPLDPEYPTQRLEYMMKDSQAPVLLTEKRHLAKISDGRFQRILIDADWPHIALEEAANLPNDSLPDNLAYVLYTSGSTGRPKGVAATHRGCINRFSWTWNHFPFAVDEIASQKSALSVVGSIWELFGGLLQGVPTVIFNEATRRDVGLFFHRLEQRRVSRLVVTPSLLQAMLDHASINDSSPFPKMRYWTVSGEQFPKELAVGLRHRNPDSVILNLYGSTENGSDVLWSRVEAADPNRKVAIGRPMSNSRVAILNTHHEFLPSGVGGQLLVSGDCLARGYLHRPRLSAETFVPCSFPSRPGERSYLTGDRCRWVNGEIEYIGRQDQQIKVRGFRVEKGEVEAALRSDPQIRDAVVTIRTQQPNREQLLAHLVANAQVTAGKNSLTAESILQRLRTMLPPHMIPSHFTVVDEFPLTPSGKVDRNALHQIQTTTLQPTRNYVPAKNGLEREISTLWKEVLNLPEIGVTENFFELGGHSLLATHVVSRLQKQQQVRLPVRALFEAPTIRGLARKIERLAKTSLSATATQISVVDRNLPLRLSFAQERMWFLSQLNEGSTDYHITFAVHLRGNLDIQRVESSIQSIIQRHESMRTSFESQSGEPRQRVVGTFPWSLPCIDLAETQLEDEPIWHNVAMAHWSKPLNLEQPPLWRIVLLRKDRHHHILVGTIHHIIFDGWSAGLFYRELLAGYERKNGVSVQPRLHYVDYAAWQREQLDNGELVEELTYWKTQLQGKSRCLELPLDRPRPKHRNGSGGVYTDSISGEITAKLRHLSQQADTTLFMTLGAAFVTLLHRYDNSADDISIGTPIANRDAEGAESMFGMFVNTIVLSTRVDDDPTFAELLVRFRETSLAAYSHQQCPFEKLVEELKPPRTLGETPLFQVMFVFQSMPLKSLDRAGLAVQIESGETGRSKFDLTLSITEWPDQIVTRWEFASDIFDASTIQRMQMHLEMILQQVVITPDRKLSQFHLLSNREVSTFSAWNDTENSRSAPINVHQLFEAQARKTPDAVAILEGSHHITYGELNRRANRLAGRLRERGITREHVVGVCVPRSIDTIIGMLAIWKAGGAYLPLDPADPAARLSRISRDAQVSAILSRSVFRVQLSGNQTPVIGFDEEEDGITTSVQRLSNVVDPSNLAYVMYTSGSTGVPKGVQIDHSAIVGHVLGVQESFRLAASDRMLQFASLNFDASLDQILVPLSVGACVVLRDEELMGGHELLLHVKERQINVLNLPPSYLHRCLLEWIKHPESCLSTPLRLLISGGEPLAASHLQLWQQLGIPNVRVVNAYGPTEATVTATSYTIPTERTFESDAPIGTPHENRTAWILDHAGHQVPVNALGELCLGGIGLARGYCGQPDATSRQFVPDSLGKTPGARLYRSGDLAVHRADGVIIARGRIDTQLKLRGIRIEPGEIEFVLCQHDDVHAAVVRKVNLPEGGERLVAYVVPVVEGAVSSNSLREFLSQHLPSKQIPSTIVFLNSFPLTAQGKLDYSAFPVPRWEAQQTTLRPASNVIEETLANIWREVLNIDRIGVDDNFFEMGGDSIVSLMIVAKAREAGLQIATKQVFQHQTISELAANVEHMVESHLETDRQPTYKSAPLTPIQQWFFEQEFEAPNQFGQSMVLELTSPISPLDGFRIATSLVKHHDALTSRFQRSSRQWKQHFGDGTSELSYRVTDISLLSEPHQQTELEEFVAQSQHRLNIHAGPLIDFVLIPQTSKSKTWLLLSIHHLVVDGISWRILLEDIRLLIDQCVRGRALKLPSKTASFASWSHALDRFTRSDMIQSQKAYWRDRISRRVDALPVDHPPGEKAAAKSDIVTVSLDQEQTIALLRKVPAIYRTEINDVLLTALAMTWQKQVGGFSLRIDLEAHGRESFADEMDVSRTVGWFSTLFPIVLELEENEQIETLLISVKEQLRDIPLRGIGFGLLRYIDNDPKLRNLRNQSSTSQICFNYLGQFDQTQQPDESHAIRPKALPYNKDFGHRRSYLHEINAIVADQRLHVNWRYHTHLHERGTVERFAQTYIDSLDQIIRHCLAQPSSRFTPSDFALSNLSQHQLDRVIARSTKVQAKK